MKTSELAALLNEPACTHNLKSKSGCARPTPGATAGGCTFDGAQIALLPIADVAHIVHGPSGCAGSSWDSTAHPFQRSDPVQDRHDHRFERAGRDHGRGEKRLFHAVKQAIDRYSPAAAVYST